MADFFSLGVVVYELLFARLPYEAMNRLEYREQVLSFQTKVKRKDLVYVSISEECVDFLNRLLIRRPGIRLGANGIEVKFLQEEQFFSHFSIFSHVFEILIFSHYWIFLIFIGTSKTPLVQRLPMGGARRRARPQPIHPKNSQTGPPKRLPRILGRGGGGFPGESRDDQRERQQKHEHELQPNRS